MLIYYYIDILCLTNMARHKMARHDFNVFISVFEILLNYCSLWENRIGIKFKLDSVRFQIMMQVKIFVKLFIYKFKFFLFINKVVEKTVKYHNKVT